MTSITSGYAGADWIEASLKRECSPFGRLVADLLGVVFVGIYHLDDRALLRADWANHRRIELTIGWTDLATYDGARLTQLVILAHDAAVRFSIAPCNPRYLRLIFHPRSRGGDMAARHATIEDAVALVRSHCRVEVSS